MFKSFFLTRLLIKIEKLNKIAFKFEVSYTKFELMEELQQEIDQLRAQLTGDMFHDMEIKDQIHNLEMKLNGVKPMDSHFDCVGCGS